MRRLFAVAVIAVLCLSCALNNESHKKQFWIDWAQTDEDAAPKLTSPESMCDRVTESSCAKTPQPAEIWIIPGHKHVVTVGHKSNSRFHAHTTSDIATTHEIGGNDCSFMVEGKALGVADLTIETDDRRRVVQTKVRGVSHRVTVVGWVDGDKIQPNLLAPNHSATVEHAFETDRATFKQLVRIYLATAPDSIGIRQQPPSLPFLTSEPDDRLYVEAILLKRSANEPPDRELSKVQQSGDFRLLADFRVAGGEATPFATFPIASARIGRTPSPFLDPLLPRRLLDDFAEKLEEAEVDVKMNGRVFCSCRHDAVEIVAQGRVGKFGQLLQRVFTDWTRPTGEATPWIWAAIRFSRSGKFTIATQRFPTYAVYIDGVRHDDLTRSQEILTDFLKLDHNSHFFDGDLAPKAVNISEGGCRCDA